MGKKFVQTTVALPEELLEAVDRAVREGVVKNRNEFLNVAARHELAALERARIDKAFGFMAADPFYKAEAEELGGEFDRASWEALRAAEGEATSGYASKE